MVGIHGYCLRTKRVSKGTSKQRRCNSGGAVVELQAAVTVRVAEVQVAEAREAVTVRQQRQRRRRQRRWRDSGGAMMASGQAVT